MKKLDIFLIVLTVVLAVSLIIVSVFLFNEVQKNKNVNNQNITFYGQRGNISSSEKIMFLTKNEDLLAGMMGLEYSTSEKKFDQNDMITFANYVAYERYNNILEKQTSSNGENKYIIDKEIIDDIVEEFFGTYDLIHEEIDHELYSRSRGYYIFDKEYEKSMWFYPVNEETIEVTDSNNVENLEDSENSETTENEENNVKEKNVLITADSIYIDETKEEGEYKNIKYDGMYDENIVEYTIKFRYDENGKLISYQYIENN